MQGQRECHRLSHLSFQVKYQRLNLGVGPSQCREVRKYSISYIISLFIHGIKAEVPSLQLCLHDRMTNHCITCAKVQNLYRYDCFVYVFKVRAYFWIPGVQNIVIYMYMYMDIK